MDKQELIALAAKLTEAQRGIVLGLGPHELAIADASGILPARSLSWQARRLREMGVVSSRLNEHQSFLMWRLTPLGLQIYGALRAISSQEGK